MRFAAVVTGAAAALISVGAVPATDVAKKRDLDVSLNFNLGNLFDGFDLSNTNNYGAPIPPWVPGNIPGWYYGPNPANHPDLPCLGGLICKILELIPWCIHCPPQYTPPPYGGGGGGGSPPPPPPSNSTDGYTPTFTNITAAVQANDYMTFGLVETVADCLAMCDSVSGCTFVNTYHDVNGKNGSPDLTCALFQDCHGPQDADNTGGQTQPDGSVDFITDSDGWCKESTSS